MGLESATYISGLDVDNPAGSDGISAGDNHLRLIKSVLKNTLPNADEAINGIHTGGSAPSPNTSGQLWFDTSSDILKMYPETGSTWLEIFRVGGNNVIKVTRLEDNSTASIRSSSMTYAATFSVVIDSATSDLLIQANLFGGLWAYARAQTGEAQVYNATDSAAIGSDWKAGGQWNNVGGSASDNNEIRSWTTMTVAETTPLSAGTKSIKIRANCSNPGDGGISTSMSSLTVWEIE